MRAGQSRAKPVRRAASNSFNSCFTSTDVYAKLQATVAAPCLVYGKLHYGCCPKLRPQPPGQLANTSKPSQVLCNSKTWKHDLHLKTWKVTCFQNMDKTQFKRCILKKSLFFAWNYNEVQFRGDIVYPKYFLYLGIGLGKKTTTPRKVKKNTVMLQGDDHWYVLVKWLCPCLQMLCVWYVWLGKVYFLWYVFLPFLLFC